MKAGLEGVSVFVSSGGELIYLTYLLKESIFTYLFADDGAAGSNARNSAANCGYSPSFPATSQYVTAVGGKLIYLNYI